MLGYSFIGVLIGLIFIWITNCILFYCYYKSFNNPPKHMIKIRRIKLKFSTFINIYHNNSNRFFIKKQDPDDGMPRADYYIYYMKNFDEQQLKQIKSTRDRIDVIVDNWYFIYFDFIDWLKFKRWVKNKNKYDKKMKEKENIENFIRDIKEDSENNNEKK